MIIIQNTETIGRITEIIIINNIIKIEIIIMNNIKIIVTIKNNKMFILVKNLI